MMQLIYAERPELKGKIYIAYCPERVLPGNVLYELEHNDRVIGESIKSRQKKQSNSIHDSSEGICIKRIQGRLRCVN